MQVIWAQGVRQLGINHTRSALRRSGVGYHVKVPQLLVVGGTDQYFTKHGGDQYRYLQPAYSGRQTLWQVFTRILQAGLRGGLESISCLVCLGGAGALARHTHHGGALSGKPSATRVRAVDPRATPGGDSADACGCTTALAA